MPTGSSPRPLVEIDAAAEQTETPYTLIIFGAHRLPIAVDSLICASDDQAMQAAGRAAAACPGAYGYEMWFDGAKLAAYFSQTALSQDEHMREPVTLRQRSAGPERAKATRSRSAA
jgi:hypothetical protein